MKDMTSTCWDTIYINSGEVQSSCLDKVRNIIPFLKEMNCERILDLGCGTGRHSILLAKNGFRTYSTDISLSGLSILIDKIQCEKYKNIYVASCDMKDLVYKDNYFDAVICVLTLDHGIREEVKKTINEIYRVLSPGGIVLFDSMSDGDESFGKGIKIEDHSYMSSLEGEDNVTHHYTNETEMKKFCSKFSETHIEENTYIFNDNETIKSIDVCAIK